jgi:hypothetical protein
MIKNTHFDNLVNYETNSSSSCQYVGKNDSSSDPTSLSFIMKNRPLIFWKLLTPDEALVVVKDEKRAVED